ncbi:MAG: hypothetical protein V7K69_28560 [Nostoc sp.]|uniref:hypothetical protein n=1 Tax=Nostoc sp. TaxID=1180 RepID=UPI002FFA2490
MERTKVPNTYQIGEVYQILAKDNPELRGKDSCWAIVSAVNNFRLHGENMGWRVRRWVTTPEVLQLSAYRV